MKSPAEAGITNPGDSIRLWIGLALVVAGFFGHYIAAQAIGGTHVAYRDHMLGFVGFAVISGAIVAGLGWRFWRGRHDITVLVFGLLQAILGVIVYIQRFSVHG